MTVATMSPEVQTLCKDLGMETDATRELWTVARLMERPPYFFAEKGAEDTRLARAVKRVEAGDVTANEDGTYTVRGSKGQPYVCGDTCPCPQGQKGHSKYCVHLVMVVMFREWQRRLRPVMALPLPPTTVEERLALDTIHDNTALSTSHVPVADGYDVTQEELMASEDEEAYIPEPATDHVTTAVLEPPAAPAVTRPLPGPVLLPSLDAQSLKRSMQEWSAQRQVIKSFLQQELKEGVDFYRLQVRGKDANPTLSKAGAEKFLGLFQLQASFAPDLLTWEMLGKPTDHVIYICTLRTRSGEIVGEGRGSRSLKKDSGDTNKAIKMSEKSALIDAVLRTGALSEVYTQDIEDGEPDTPAQAPTPAQTAPAARPTAQSQALRKQIWAHVNTVAPQIKTQDDAEAWVLEKTGLAMEQDHYSAILANLQGVGA